MALFHLLKEAQLASKLDANELKVLESARVALGKKSIADLVESFNPSTDDYNEWLRVIAEEGADRGVNLTRKQEFMDLAFEVLDNDPLAPPADMQELIVNKLWNDYKAARHGARIAKVAQAQEEEEQAQAAHDFAHSEYASDEQPGCADGECSDLDVDTTGETDIDMPGAGQDGDEYVGDDMSQGDLSVGDVPAGASVSFELPADDETASLSDDDIEAIASRIVSQLKDGEASSEAPVEQENEETTKPKSTNLQQMLSGPRSTITQAQREIEAEGEAAWKAHQVPSNPHPKKSIAFAAWERGMKRAAKAHFGFEEKPVVQPKKKK